MHTASAFRSIAPAYRGCLEVKLLEKAMLSVRLSLYQDLCPRLTLAISALHCQRLHVLLC